MAATRGLVLVRGLLAVVVLLLLVPAAGPEPGPGGFVAGIVREWGWSGLRWSFDSLVLDATSAVVTAVSSSAGSSAIVVVAVEVAVVAVVVVVVVDCFA